MASHPIFQFYVELKDYEPKIWRRFQVMNNLSLSKLGYILMTMFEMEGSHLIAFEVDVADNWKRHDPEFFKKVYGRGDLEPPGKVRYEIIRDYFENLDMGDLEDAVETGTKDVLYGEGDRITFYYDFGDGWELEVVLENRFVDKELPGRDLPRVLEGEGYGIIEDCGGPDGLMEVAKAFKKKKGLKYQEFRRWLDMDHLDLGAFDLEDMNYRVKRLPRIYQDIYEFAIPPSDRSMKLLNREYLKK